MHAGAQKAVAANDDAFDFVLIVFIFEDLNATLQFGWKGILYFLAGAIVAFHVTDGGVGMRYWPNRLAAVR